MSTELTSMWLFDSLLVTSLLMAAILVARRPVARMFGPGVAYALWALPALRLLMPSLAGPAIEETAATGSVSDAVRDSILAQVQNPSPVNAAGELAAAPSIDWIALAITVWLGGAALFFLLQMIRYASMRDDLLADVEELGTIDGVRIVQSDRVAGPLAFGLFRRYIAVPIDFTRAYSPAERELAIAHEMAHHKSGDLFANVAAFTILCLQWFNPLAWMSWNAFRFDQEAACDARVLAGKGAAERQAYGRALARAACDGVPTFATALNSPKTIIERLRRLTMKDASKQRRSLGKLGILAAAAVILPLTATIVPAMSQDSSETAAAPEDNAAVKKQRVKIIKVNKEGQIVDYSDDGSDVHVKKVERDGKTFVFHTDKELSQAEVEDMMAEAEESREAAEDARAVSEEARAEAMAARTEAEAARGQADVMRQHAEEARGHAEAMRLHAIAMAANYIPEIDIKEIRANCAKGQPVSTNVTGFDGQKKSKIRIVMCGKGQAKIARVEAISGLREALSEIKAEPEMPEPIRAQIVVRLNKEIKKLEGQND